MMSEMKELNDESIKKIIKTKFFVVKFFIKGGSVYLKSHLIVSRGIKHLTLLFDL